MWVTAGRCHGTPIAGCPLQVPLTCYRPSGSMAVYLPCSHLRLNPRIVERMEYPMRFVMKVSIPVEKFNAAVRDGSAGKKLQIPNPKKKQAPSRPAGRWPRHVFLGLGA